jgi:hypothetical protein
MVVAAGWVDARELSGQGFHRRLLTALSLRLPASGAQVGPAPPRCQVVLRERLERTTYVDLDEVAELRRLAVPRVPDVEPLGFRAAAMDVERPAEASEAREVAVASSAVEAALVPGGGLEVRAAFELPVHLRYQRPSAELEFRPATLSTPRTAWVACRGETSPDEAGGAARLRDALPLLGALERGPVATLADAWGPWSPVPLAGGEDSVVAYVPVGSLTVERPVIVGTALIAVLGALVLAGLALKPLLAAPRRAKAKAS